ncbi:MAG: autotransporter outer membrane beta-barrel domain-containing protein [Deltaproteobacteria bacterium]|nr:autotransporter outer membrane beta-barrel domain-containing protein [Deltaproteobacteria bacterium]
MLANFPPVNREEPAEVRAQLSGIDLEADVAREETLDDRETAVELHLGYGGETIGTSVALDGVALPDLGTGAIAPSGVLRLGLGARHRAPGGFTISGAGFFGRAPGDFARSYYQDGPNPTGTSNRSANVVLERVQLFGAEARGGYSLLLGDGLTLVPSAGLYFEAWSLKVTPTLVVPDDLHLRLGLVVGADLNYRLGKDSGWYLRGGPLVRVGLDFSGPASFGAGLDVGVGVRL